MTILALIAFAANSVLCRLALGDGSIDWVSFTVIRLLSGALTLLLILKINGVLTKPRYPDAQVTGKNNQQSLIKQQQLMLKQHQSAGSWLGGVMLFVYAASFSYAYTLLDTATGALILFAAVQLTMILLAIIKGARLKLIEWLGVITAFVGFVYLVVPDINSPSMDGLLFMTISGIAWGVYTLKGKQTTQPLRDTCANFVRSIPLVLVLFLVSLGQLELSDKGVWLAIIAGSVTSAMGYSIWYVALNGLSATKAAVVQLSVPVIAAFGGVIFVAETLTSRLMIASIVVLTGMLMVVQGKSQSKK